MWFPVTVLLLVGLAVATPDHDHAWEKGHEYQYLVQSRTLAGLDKLNEQYTGVQIKGLLTIQVKTPEILQAKLSNPQYSHIHNTLPNGPGTEISDQNLEYQPLPMSGKPFEIRLKHGVIRNLLVDRSIPTWELNILDSLVSQLQVDTQGENAIKSKSIQIPQNEHSHAMFSAMEDSVSGKCEVLYEITPVLNNSYPQERPDRVPFPELRGEYGQHFIVNKVKNYERCQQRKIYQNGQLMKESLKPQVVSPYTVTQLTLSGNLKRFVIQSVVTNAQISVSLGKSNPFLGNVYSVMKLSLVERQKLSNSQLGSLESTNLESIGNLMYTQNNPFSDTENRKERQPSVSWNSMQRQSSESSSSSSQEGAYKSHSRSSSSSSSSSEENYIPDPEPTAELHLAPNVPLLPFFIGYKGKNIQMSDKVNAVDDAYNIIYKIADELQNPSQTLRQYVECFCPLEKFVILKNLLRVMNYEQYTELVNRVVSGDGIQNKQRHTDSKAVLRDAVAQAGTGPALLTIQNWLHNGKLGDAEAARVISQIPKNVRKPTAKYVRAFFDMIVHPAVLEQKYVNVSAPIALGQLINNGLTIWQLSPKQSSSAKDNNAVIDLGISYLTDKLKEGFDENNGQKIQTFIMALASTGHQKIISVFEPYLEGTQPASNFQRLLIVSSLSGLARTQPKLVGPIFYKLYVNELEDHEIRCIAVQLFILTNPPLITLQRVAKYTHFDKNEQVNSAVKTTLQSLANTKRSELHNIASKARLVTHLLNPKKSANSMSRSYYKDIENWIVKGFYLQTVSSDNSPLPALVHFGVNTIFDFVQQPTLGAGYTISNIQQLVGKLWHSEEGNGREEAPQKSRVEKLAQALKIKPEYLNKLEGNVYLDTMYNLIFYPFESNSVPSYSKLQDFWKKNQKLESTVFNNYESTVSFPIETNGLPFVYSLESPTLMKLQLESKTEKSANNVKEGTIKVLLGNRMQRRFGFVAPFEHQNYMAGIDDNQLLQVPVELQVDYNMNQKTIRLMIRPKLPQNPMDSQLTLWHHATVPFTTRQDILNLQPVLLDKNTHHVLTSKKHKTAIEKDLFSLKVESDIGEIEQRDLGNSVAKLWELHKANDGHFKKVGILMNPEQARRSELRINIAYDNLEVNALNKQSREMDPAWGVPLPSNKPNSTERKNQIMQSLARGLQSGKVYVFDMNYNVPTSEEPQVLSAGFVRSNLDRKSKAFLYWNSQSPQMEGETKNEACYLQEINNSPDTPLDFEYTLKNPPVDNVRAELLYGKRCEGGNKVVIDGKATRSDQLQEILENSEAVKQCRQEIQKGNKLAPVCQKAIESAQVRDQYDVIIGPDGFFEKLWAWVIKNLSDLLNKILNVEVTNSRADTVSIRINALPLMVNAVPMAFIRIPKLNLTFPHPMETTMNTQQLTEAVDSMLQNQLEQDSCTLDEHKITTFDKRTFPVTMGAVKHVMLTTYPQQDPDNRNQMTIPEKMRAAILAEDGDYGTKSVTVYLGNHEVQLYKYNNHLQVKVGGQVVEVSQYKSYQGIQNGEVIYEIFELPDGSIAFNSDIYLIHVVYNGEYVQIRVSDQYRNNIRGLCGNYDRNPSNDFLTPQNCILMKPEEFAATYALLQENSQGPVVENKRKAEQAQCYELPSGRHLMRNVISDKEAGRQSTEGKNWGYHHENRMRVHGQNRARDNKQSPEVDGRPDDFQVGQNIIYRTKVVEEGDELCFTTSPVPTCREGTVPVERKLKKYPLYCQMRNEESTSLKQRVENGANPDLSRKPATKSHVFQAPQGACSAA
ncbi:vitellogenin-2-like [Temnothorax longispinosus]|uniref:vitellogenin-2-like n=1 Tax=Temnothorax longispinosus TaxID=300112 RepID=UPI003A9A1EEA